MGVASADSVEGAVLTLRISLRCQVYLVQSVRDVRGPYHRLSPPPLERGDGK
jgi:hypothetical protein